jgi:hypothetical protein
MIDSGAELGEAQDAVIEYNDGTIDTVDALDWFEQAHALAVQRRL